MSKFIDAQGRTTLPWNEYKQKALIIRENFGGKNWWPEVRKQLGVGYWEKDGVLTEYKMMSAGDSISRKPIAQDKLSKQKSGNKRNLALSKANKLIGNILSKTGQNKATGIMALGASRNADHIIEVQTFGPALEQLDQELKAKAITKAEYKRRLAILKNYKIGDHPQNIQNLHWAKNQEKMKVVEAKNKALKNMEIKNPSLRNQTPKMSALMSSILKSKDKKSNLSGIKSYLTQKGAQFTPNAKGGTRDVIQTDIPNPTAKLEDLWESKVFGSQFGPPLRGV